jgi:prephenate dehydratase
MKIAIQGQQASFHDIAARQFFGQDIDIIACETFAETFERLADGQAEQAVVAIENSLFGSINEVYDLLLKEKTWIRGEVYQHISQCLIGLPGASLANIKEVHSHPVALAQCEAYLNANLPQAERFEHHDTAGSVADVKQWNDPTKAAIASRGAAELHGMAVLAEEIETHKQNYTRFVVVQPQPPASSEVTSKTSMVLVTSHQPGALYHALGAFAKQSINLTKLQSRPIIGQTWHYMFYVDVSVGSTDPALQTALVELKTQNCEVTILGSYQAGDAEAVTS